MQTRNVVFKCHSIGAQTQHISRIGCGKLQKNFQQRVEVKDRLKNRLTIIHVETY